MRTIAILGAILALAASPAVAIGGGAAQRPEPQTTLPDVSDEVMCTVCGVLLDEAPDAPQAQRERAFIRREIAQGKTKEEIKADLVDEYGEQVLAEPGTSGFDLAAWIVPAIAILLAAAAIAIGLRRWRRAADAVAQIRPMQEAQLDSADRERLESDLERYEL